MPTITGCGPDKAVLGQNRIHSDIVRFHGHVSHQLAFEADTQRFRFRVAFDPSVVIALSASEPRTFQVEGHARHDYEIRRRRFLPAKRFVRAERPDHEFRLRMKPKHPGFQSFGKGDQFLRRRIIAKPIRLAGKGYETKNDARSLPSFPVSQMLTDFF
jgi:hypothetical protein